MGKKFKREDTRICIADSFCCTVETNNIVKPLYSNKKSSVKKRPIHLLVIIIKENYQKKKKKWKFVERTLAARLLQAGEPHKKKHRGKKHPDVSRNRSNLA